MAGELEIPRRSFSIVMAGNTPDEHKYQVKVLDKILEETGGKISPVGEDPTFKKRDFLTMIKACFIPRLAFRLTGTFQVDGMIGMDTQDAASLGLKVNEGHRDKYARMGVIMEDGTLNSWGVSFEGTHFALFECGQQYSAINMESIKGRQQMENEGFEICYKTPFSFSWVARCEEFLKRIGPTCCNFHDWMRKIKKNFDPNCVSDPMNYIPAEESK